jgi:hypothetical protein
MAQRRFMGEVRGLLLQSYSQFRALCISTLAREAVELIAIDYLGYIVLV